jgi:peptidoglycan/xylan/chitin deacetylase (PgdA/CDA1 family)
MNSERPIELPRDATDLSSAWRQTAVRSLAASPLPNIIARWRAGIGSILTFHRISDASVQDAYATNALCYRPTQFREALRALLDQGIDFVSMGEILQRMRQSQPRKFVALTFDDGFIDTYTEAFAACKELGIPITVYVATGPMLRRQPMWWIGLAQLVAQEEEIDFPWNGTQRHYAAATPFQKRNAYRQLARLFSDAAPRDCLALCEALEARYSISFMAVTDHYAIRPELVVEMHRSGIVEIGAHTVTHANLRAADADTAVREFETSRRDLETLIGAPVRHFAYPYGKPDAAGPREFALCRELGFETGVTTRMANIFAHDIEQPYALPRLSMNGNYQSTALLDLLMSGTVPMIMEAAGFVSAGNRGCP